MKLYTTKIEYLSELASAVPAAKRNGASAGRLCAYGLLRAVLLQEYGFTSMPEIYVSTNGRPELPASSGLYFSLSHCPSRVLCAVGSEPLGCDIEESTRSVSSGIARRLMSTDELFRWQAAGCQAADILRLWTLKEAYIKFSGEKIQSMRSISFDLSGSPCCKSASVQCALITDIPHYTAALCSAVLSPKIDTVEISTGELLKYT